MFQYLDSLQLTSKYPGAQRTIFVKGKISMSLFDHHMPYEHQGALLDLTYKPDLSCHMKIVYTLKMTFPSSPQAFLPNPRRR